MHDVEWLKRSLQVAIEVELATIPPYLCAMWSIVDLDHDVRYDIRPIVLQEMLHMGLACNMLTTLGGTPNLNSPCAVPTYPGPLPGDVRPQLLVWLAGFSRAMVRAVFMEIEQPEHEPVARFLGQSYPTIGAFYSAIGAAFANVDPSCITGARQRTNAGLNLVAIRSAADAAAAIKTIKEQGEGTSEDPFPSGMPSTRAHYYRFAELYHGQRLIEVDGRWQYAGPEVPLPEAYPMVEVPPGGYPESRSFDALYTSVLDDLQAAWQHDDQAAFDRSVNTMQLRLEEPARELMRRPLPSGVGNYGPSFQIVR